MTGNFFSTAVRFGWPNACPCCGAALPQRGGLRDPQDWPFGQRCAGCGESFGYIPETLGEGPSRRVWWIPARPADRYSRVSGREIVTPSTVEWEELGGGPGRSFCVLDPSRSLVPRTDAGRWRGALKWRLAATVGGSESISSVVLARGMLVVTGEGGTVRFLDPATGAPVTRQPLLLRQDLHSEAVLLPPTFRGWWMAVVGERALVLTDLSPMATNRNETALPRRAIHLPAGWRWASAPMAVSGEKLLFAALAEAPDGAAKLIVLDPLPIRAGLPPARVAEVPMRPAAAPVQLPDLPDFPRAGQILWVGRDGAVHAIDPATWVSQMVAPPPLPPVRLRWTDGNIAVSADSGEEALWMVQTNDRDQPVLRRWPIGGMWSDHGRVNPEILPHSPWLSVHPWQPDRSDAWITVAGSTYYEMYSRAVGADTAPLNRTDQSRNLHFSANVAARTVSPPILTPAGLVTFHPFEVRLTSGSPLTHGLSHVQLREALCGASSSFFTFAAARGATVWCGTEGGEIVRVDFSQETS